ncbi:Tetratricopeptide repeat protein [Sulfidibacter corallicola]|uniref:Tetratricopeptide repeat protein n=1 Tax=Sulfidibacter corallicola TaxID=2818388 RepID=A0A8A4TIZ7_SULCO|nr:tetratricopeptide repeat protein [Sulfidibacter corallicola]QTD48768.1 tetratricopeptide repeat protein [Sulfidibacter corallicola]
MSRTDSENDDQSPRGLAHHGEALFRAGRLPEALVFFDRALAAAPNYAWALAHRADLYREMKRFGEALDDFDRALSLERDYPWARAHRGAVLYHMRRYPAALADLDHVIEGAPDYVWALAYRPHIYIALKRYEAALADVDAFLALDKSLLPSWQGERGMILNYLGRFEESIAGCEDALADDPRDYIAVYTRAVALACGATASMAYVPACRDLLVRFEREGLGEPGLVAYRLGALAALEGDVDTAFSRLEQAISLHHEPIETARHDPAWRGCHDAPRYRELIAPAEVSF